MNGVLRLRAAGLMGPGECKWEREHPRWPGSTTVYRYFGSWPAAVEAARLQPVTRTRDDSLAERVEAAKRMHVRGRSVHSIAEELELSTQAVYRYLKAHPCAECAAAVVGDGPLCHACSTRQANPRRWSGQEVLGAVREWARFEGRPPTQQDWRPARAGGAERWQREFPRWPPTGVARLLFGGGNAMLTAAGVTPNHPSWQPEQILPALRRYAEEFGRPPAKQDLDWPPVGYPSARTVRRHFGSFTAGIRAAGLEPAGKRWSQAQIAEAIAAFRRQHDRPPRPADWVKAGERTPSAGTVYKRFGTWDAALAAGSALNSPDQAADHRTSSR